MTSGTSQLQWVQLKITLIFNYLISPTTRTTVRRSRSPGNEESQNPIVFSINNCAFEFRDNELVLVLPMAEIRDISTVREFQDCENCLRLDDNAVTKLKEKIRQRGGNSAAHHMERGLKYCMKASMGQELSWDGQDGRTSFKDTLICHCLIDSVMGYYPNEECPDEVCCQDDLEEVIKAWFRKCREED